MVTACAILVTACSNSVSLKVESSVPEALVRKLPLTVGVYYDQEFSEYRYSENSDERRDWNISSGAAQVAVFDGVLASRFERVVRLSLPPSVDDADDYDLAIVPGIVEMQFATPAETGFEFYETWIQYRIGLFDRTGTKQESWDIAAYGKAPVKRFKLWTDGLNEAIEYALRDIGAKFSTGLPQRAAIVKALDAAT